MTNEQYMLEALKEAKLALEENEVPIGAIIVCNDEIIGRGHNQREKLQQTYGHAEMLAISQACEKLNSWKLDNCVMYVTVEPCPMCAGTILQSRIDKVYFATEDKKAGAFGSLMDLTAVQKLTNCPKLNKGLLEEEAKELLKEFFTKLRTKEKQVVL